MPEVTGNDEKGEPNLPSDGSPPAKPKEDEEDAKQRQKDFAVAAQLKFLGILQSPDHFVPLHTVEAEPDIREALLRDFENYKKTISLQKLKVLYNKYYENPTRLRKQIAKRQRCPQMNYPMDEDDD